MPILVWLILAWDALTGRKPVVRSGDEQTLVDRETAKLSLYHFRACPYCRKVRRDLRLWRLHLPAYDVRRDPSRLAELMAGGGKKQVPCLRIVEDDGTVHWMYESRAIGGYLVRRFATPVT
jgi:glutathione S-transferase